jgi:hypothetical protein
LSFGLPDGVARPVPANNVTRNPTPSVLPEGSRYAPPPKTGPGTRFRLAKAVMPPHVPERVSRFAQLVKELNQAILDNDNEREARLYSELESISAPIRANPQIESSTRSRERQRIVGAINRSLEKIRKNDPILARTLRTALKTRGFFSYSPQSGELANDPTDSESESKKTPHKK